MDRIIIGAGIYGLYAAIESLKKGHTVTVLEMDRAGFCRGSYVNQARLHSGYHYPRSKETAIKSRDYFFRFMNDFSSAINTNFKQLYAISHDKSLTTKEDFVKFCSDLNIKCDEIDKEQYFKPGMVDGLFETLEYAIDCKAIYLQLISECRKYDNFDICFNTTVQDISYINGRYKLLTTKGIFEGDWLLNATYANTNNIINMLDSNLPKIDMKYELCEVILCDVSDNMNDVGITVMDGPFFSIMPFGHNTYSLTSVCHTPHTTNVVEPKFDCQKKCQCSKSMLHNCDECEWQPVSKVDEMLDLARHYLKDDITIIPRKKLFAIKPILNSCEKDDARPTIIKTFDNYPNFITVFSGKLNTMYDLDEVL